MLNTETPHPEHSQLDQYPAGTLVDALLADQCQAALTVQAAAAGIADAVEAMTPRIAAGGRLIYAGAGTSGRLGVLDSVELYPTFSWPRERAVALLAGGRGAMFEAVEGAEDDEARGALDLGALRPGASDVVLLLAASGATPYVLGALKAARAAGALTVGIANNPDTPLARGAEIGITVATGPEIISGSTRLKAGTAQKIVLNTLSSALMVKLNKVYGNLMVDLKASNAKLVRRAVRLTMAAAQVDEATARAMLERCGYQVKVAIVALLRQEDAATAQARLARTEGSIRAALAALD